jgi:hypothetical protein
MARCPFATWTPAAPENFSTQAITPTFIVEHIAQGLSQSGISSWFRNPTAQVSAHFSISLLGHINQHVDTNETAWHCANLNDKAIGIENLGYSGHHLTFFQKRAQKKLLAWIHEEHRIHLALTFNQNDTNGGVIPHGKIDEGTLSHTDCPGQPVINDVHDILIKMNVEPIPPKKVGPTQEELNLNNLVALPNPAAEALAKKDGWAIRWYDGKGFPAVTSTTKRGITHYSNSNYVILRTKNPKKA